MPDTDQIRSCLYKRIYQRLPYGGLAVGDEHLAEFRVAGELAQLPVVCHVRSLLLGKCDQHRLPGAVEHRSYTYSCRRFFNRPMKMGHHGRAAVEPRQSQPPRQPLAKEQIIAVMQDGVREEFSIPRLWFPLKLNRKAMLAGFPRRVLYRAAVAALLQLQAALRCGRRQAERDAAARRRRQRRQPCPEDGIFTSWTKNRFSHDFAMMTAPEPRPRSKLIMPKPLTSASFASFTWRAPASPVSCLIASTRPRKPPAAPACPTESCPPLVLRGNEPSQVKLCLRTKSAPSPLAQKPRSSSCISEITG